MITVVSIMAGGMLLGFLLRAKQRIVSGNEKLITYAIYLLLFMMGVSIGSNEQIMNSLSTLGIVALIVSMGAIIGSILTGFLVFKLFFKND
ncbi:MAG: LysO family transporter [Tenuifilum sp.]|uniref:LysO family transporter n=1 Tax=Tenuifilum sp. TaxID=2760880 RepID=UPI001B4848D7|nr:LysO family transporter [Bacteroidales bacterium]HOK61035.1 LysO family transporter [Tenuifilum sp.]MBP9028164.1 LysO family transporter [Bacteroidales bacterium]HOK85017.1 LysO family transporter [Tenuifilum sp.]HON70455.1 LysO family transporter [Tenuifilum sp.]